ncbi:uncharacterized protein LOC143013179 [Genypterus blacodes]|uniref:uncharacterized protein LOC143013179 n=1 Tax=Genypterus blacodes TaxID=154954 RepID=UPI003F77625A
MYQAVLFLQFLLLHSATQKKLEAACKEDVTLPCPGALGRNFPSLIWYKFNDQRKIGIVRKAKGKPAENYNFDRSTVFGEDCSLSLNSVTPADSGTYQCVIGAIIGGKDEPYNVTLTVPECVVQTTAKAPLTTSNHINIEEWPVLWIVICYCGIGLGKIVFSLLSIGVARAAFVTSST